MRAPRAPRGKALAGLERGDTLGYLPSPARTSTRPAFFAVQLLHSITLFLHSYLRWLVLLLGLTVLVRAAFGWRLGRQWTPTDERTHAAFVGTIHLQFTLGLLLYLVLSPLTAAFFASPGASMKVRELRFFGVEHVALMTVAVGIVSASRARVKKAALPVRKHRATFLATLVAFVFICAAVPWPFLHVQRPLLRGIAANRTPSSSASQPLCPPSYESRCASCHGASGHADGTLASSLTPRPRDFHDSGWQASRTDAELGAAIREGGAALGRSPLMPAHRDLMPSDVDALVRCVRSFR